MCDAGIIFGIVNFICGIFIILLSFFNDFCAWFRILFGVCICWVALTTAFCDQWALVWFPLWNRSFGFMGCSYVFLACGGYFWLSNGSEGFNGFAYFFVWAVGITYIILWILNTFCGTGCPLPTPLLSMCGAGGDKGGGDKNEKSGGQTSTKS
eukprot:373232_1